jgi:hypothetical protein
MEECSSKQTCLGSQFERLADLDECEPKFDIRVHEKSKAPDNEQFHLSGAFIKPVL